mgnify:CR=1 FL=1
MALKRKRDLSAPGQGQHLTQPKWVEHKQVAGSDTSELNAMKRKQSPQGQQVQQPSLPLPKLGKQQQQQPVAGNATGTHFIARQWGDP